MLSAGGVVYSRCAFLQFIPMPLKINKTVLASMYMRAQGFVVCDVAVCTSSLLLLPLPVAG